MNQPNHIRLQHMLDASQAALNHLAGKKRKDLDVNRTVLSAVVRELEVIGEAQPILFPKHLEKSTLKFLGGRSSP